MRHPDIDALALRALGELALEEDEERHVASCGQCRSELASLTRTAAAVRSAVAGPSGNPATAAAPLPDPVLDLSEPAPPPPGRVWRAIADELSLSPALRVDPGGSVSTGTRSGDAGPARTGWRPQRPALALAAAAAVVAGTTGSLITAALLTADDEAGGDDLPAVSAAPLEPLPEGDAADRGRGDARVVETAAGPELQVSVAGLPQTPGYHAVWLIDPESGEMVAIGVLPGTAGTASGVFPLPPGLDLDTFDLVDVSDEPLDGDPTHSGNSLLRGTLSA